MIRRTSANGISTSEYVGAGEQVDLSLESNRAGTAAVLFLYLFQ